MKKEINWIDLGLISYEDAFLIQEKIHEKCISGSWPDTLLFQENYPIITLGRGSHEKNLLVSLAKLSEMGIKLTSVSRGGDISYHGNGQLIISPILHFENYVKSAHLYLRCLEQIVIDLLREYDLEGKRIKGQSGVWVMNPIIGEDQKIAALGIALSHGVSLHGLSINVSPNLKHFETIIPCGIEDKKVTSMEALNCSDIELSTLRNQFILVFDAMFGTSSTQRTITELNKI